MAEEINLGQFLFITLVPNYMKLPADPRCTNVRVVNSCKVST
jgi:hypothetical protein